MNDDNAERIEAFLRATAPPLVSDGKTDNTAAVQWYVDHGVPMPPGTYACYGPIVVAAGAERISQ